ncbi:hypothetical protein GY45DRAFT_174614 [Cubamyces sp. BRFM 1775]|nr:hypothetical protein GY45DRAFT_174614 [Cubamyces sp. BRFM 1775]
MELHSCTIFCSLCCDPRVALSDAILGNIRILFASSFCRTHPEEHPASSSSILRDSRIPEGYESAPYPSTEVWNGRCSQGSLHLISTDSKVALDPAIVLAHSWHRLDFSGLLLVITPGKPGH